MISTTKHMYSPHDERSGTPHIMQIKVSGSQKLWQGPYICNHCGLVCLLGCDRLVELVLLVHNHSTTTQTVAATQHIYTKRSGAHNNAVHTHAQMKE